MKINTSINLEWRTKSCSFLNFDTVLAFLTFIFQLLLTNNFLKIYHDILEVRFFCDFIWGLKWYNFKCKQSILSTNFQCFLRKKSVQISKVLTKFCANFKSEKQAFLKWSFKALPIIFLQNKSFDNYKQHLICIFWSQDVN